MRGQNSSHALVFRLRGLLPLPALFIMIVWSNPTPPSFFWGGAVVVLGLAVRFWAAGYIKLYRVTEVQARDLVTAGPYARVRNPLYWGNFLIGLGYSVIANWWLGYLLFLGVYAYIYGVVIPLEEAFLAKAFGESYSRYRDQVPRLVPRLSPYPEAAGRFSLRAAVTGEWMTVVVLLFVAALFAIKLL